MKLNLKRIDLTLHSHLQKWPRSDLKAPISPNVSIYSNLGDIPPSVKSHFSCRLCINHRVCWEAFHTLLSTFPANCISHNDSDFLPLSSLVCPKEIQWPTGPRKIEGSLACKCASRRVQVWLSEASLTAVRSEYMHLQWNELHLLPLGL